MNIRIAALAFISAVSMTPPAHAQVTIDATKITCGEYTSPRVSTSKNIAAWISGYVNAKRDNALIDPAGLRDNMRKLDTFCYQQKNLQVPVMKAIEDLFGQKK